MDTRAYEAIRAWIDRFGKEGIDSYLLGYLLQTVKTGSASQVRAVAEAIERILAGE